MSREKNQRVCEMLGFPNNIIYVCSSSTKTLHAAVRDGRCQATLDPIRMPREAAYPHSRAGQGSGNDMLHF